MSVYTCLHTHTATRGWPVDQWTSSPASLHVLGFILHSLLSQRLLLLGSQRQQEKAQRLPLLWAFSFATTGPVQRLSVGHLAWPVHLYRCWWIETLSFFFLGSAACVHSYKHLKNYFLCPFFQLIFFVSWNTMVTHCYWIECNLIIIHYFCRLRGQSVTSLYKY